MKLTLEALCCSFGGFRAVDDLVVLHRGDVPTEDRDERLGWSVTTPLRTLVDVAAGDLSQEAIDAAVTDAVERGHTTRRQRLRRCADEPDDLGCRCGPVEVSWAF